MGYTEDFFLHIIFLSPVSAPLLIKRNFVVGGQKMSPKSSFAAHDLNSNYLKNIYI